MGISKGIRSKRFRVRSGSDVGLVLETHTGDNLCLTVVDCSLTGVGARSNDNEICDRLNEISEDQLIPNAKIVFNENEIYLGRLVIRYTKADDVGFFYGFQLVDRKIPIDGPASHFLDHDETKEYAPYAFELDPDKFTLASFEQNDMNSDLFAKCRQFEILHREWKKTPKYQYRTIRKASKGARINLNQRRKFGRNDYIVMGSNDYLGLAANDSVINAAVSAMKKYGFGSTGAAVSTGLTDIHERLCDKLSDMFRKESCILYNSGYAANVGAIAALAQEGDLVVADLLCHASIQDGLKMSRAMPRFFKHNNLEHCEELFEKHRPHHQGCLLVSEGVFSMDGDITPLDGIVKLARKYNARIFLDEAHSFGVLGDRGFGATERFGLQDETDIIMGTFSKICGGIGAFIVGNQEVIDWLYFFSRSNLFSVSIPPSTAAAALEALNIFEQSPELLRDLKRNISHFCLGLKQLGYPINPSLHESTIIPVVIGDEKKLGIMNQYLRENGVFVVPVVYPVVSRKRCRFRFTIMAQHSISDLDYVLNVLEQAMAKAAVNFSDLTTEKDQMAA